MWRGPAWVQSSCRVGEACRFAGTPFIMFWSAGALDRYLADPTGFVPGNKMALPGLKKADARENLIAYRKGAAQ